MQDSTSLRSFLHDSDLFAQTQGYFITWHEISIIFTWLAASDRSHGALIMFHGFLPPPSQCLFVASPYLSAPLLSGRLMDAHNGS